MRRAGEQQTVLVVEDDRTLRGFYRFALAGAGYEVLAVEDGLEALRSLESYTPALVLLDMDLPRLGGRDVQREIAARPETRDIPILVVSGTETRGLSAREFAGVLRKPVDADTLVAAVQDCLHRR